MSYMFAVTLIGGVDGSGGGSFVQHTRLLPMQEHSASVQYTMALISNPYLPDSDFELETPFTFLT